MAFCTACAPALAFLSPDACQASRSLLSELCPLDQQMHDKSEIHRAIMQFWLYSCRLPDLSGNDPGIASSLKVSCKHRRPCKRVYPVKNPPTLLHCKD